VRALAAGSGDAENGVAVSHYDASGAPRDSLADSPSQAAAGLVWGAAALVMIGAGAVVIARRNRRTAT
jgi:hypothetical protein